MRAFLVAECRSRPNDLRDSEWFSEPLRQALGTRLDDDGRPSADQHADDEFFPHETANNWLDRQLHVQDVEAAWRFVQDLWTGVHAAKVPRSGEEGSSCVPGSHTQPFGKDAMHGVN